MNRRRFLFVASLGALVPVPPPRQEVPLGDWGTMRFEPWMLVDGPRTASLIKLVFSQFVVEFPSRVTIRVVPLEVLEEWLAKHQAGPNWRQWLRIYRTEYHDFRGRLEPEKADDGVLAIDTLYPVQDSNIVHECVHYIDHAQRLEPVLATDEAEVRRTTQVFLASPVYRAWRRERPWLKE